ncbi:M23 family metallopeptidase [Agromyces larvae]|uniref:M23 family metallopeptidase n=1 Tax=Agromyces larvae TaxID=2929802 RepID=A0ABY4C4T2_9MICO|nr:M23 family metallopeptidase [Agromyces larvae]UOE43750.1 M23 family metallopeptidase [Agromyces larvae]
MTYENVNRFVVILADDRDPDVSWQHHLDRGSAGGVDCVAPMRTPVYAPTDGRLDSAWLGTGGLTARLWQAGGWRDEFMHMDQVAIAGDVKQGDLIGYSGRSGGDYAPHVHWHRVDSKGARRNPWHYFSSSPAGGDTTPIKDTPQEDTMRIYSNTDEGGACYLFFDTGWQHISDPQEAKHLALMLNGTPAATKVNGYQINWLKSRCDRNRAALVKALTA